MALTARELEVVRLLLSNGRVVSIAEELNVSPHTVRNHLRSVFRKLGVHSQVELIKALTSHMPEPSGSFSVPRH
jgi:DNA-binding CsgD family transcriptional regulator